MVDVMSGMNGYDLVASLVRSATSLGWPIAFIAAVLSFRDRLIELLPLLRLKHREWEASFAEEVKREVAAEDAEFEDTAPPHQVGALNVSARDQLVAMGSNEEEKALITAFIEHPNKARVLSSLAKETRLSPAEAFVALRALLSRGVLISRISAKTGSTLYKLNPQP